MRHPESSLLMTDILTPRGISMISRSCSCLRMPCRSDPTLNMLPHFRPARVGEQ